MYLCAIIDWHARYIVSYSLSNSLEKGFIIDTIKKAVKQYGKPEIINSDQGSQFTSEEYINLLKDNAIKISIDGKGRALDNQRIERFFRSYKWKNYILRNMRRDTNSRRLQESILSITTMSDRTNH